MRSRSKSGVNPYPFKSEEIGCVIVSDFTGWLAEAAFDAQRIAKQRGASEFSFGPGLEPAGLPPSPGYDYALPADGGRYRGKTPPQDATISAQPRRPGGRCR